MEKRLDVPPELDSLIEKREVVDRRSEDRRSDQLDPNDDTQGSEPSVEADAEKTDRRRETRRKKPRRDDE